jgi:hypothetical protein
MELITVNKDANYIVQLFKDDKWQTLTEEYSASAAINLMNNVSILTNYHTRVCSKRSDNLVLGESTK